MTDCPSCGGPAPCSCLTVDLRPADPSAPSRKHGGRNAVDVTGQRFGKLVAVARDTRRTDMAAWHCNCDCGRTTVATGSGLRTGRIVTCGKCRARKPPRELPPLHPSVTPERYRRRLRDGWTEHDAANVTPHEAKRRTTDSARLRLVGPWFGSSDAKRIKGGVTPPPSREELERLAAEGYRLVDAGTDRHYATPEDAMFRMRLRAERGIRGGQVVRVADGAVLARTGTGDPRETANLLRRVSP